MNKQGTGQLMDIGFSNNIYDNPRDLVGCIEGVARQFRAIEIEIAEEAQAAIFDASPCEYAQIVHGLRTLASCRRLIYTVHAPWFGKDSDFLSAFADERRAAVGLLMRSLEFARDIRAGVVTFHPGKSDKRENSELIRILCNTVREVARAPESESITLCLENMGAERPAYPVFTPAEHITICEEIGIRVCL